MSARQARGLEAAAVRAISIFARAVDRTNQSSGQHRQHLSVRTASAPGGRDAGTSFASGRLPLLLHGGGCRVSSRALRLDATARTRNSLAERGRPRVRSPTPPCVPRLLTHSYYRAATPLASRAPLRLLHEPASRSLLRCAASSALGQVVASGAAAVSPSQLAIPYVLGWVHWVLALAFFMVLDRTLWYMSQFGA